MRTARWLSLIIVATVATHALGLASVAVAAVSNTTVSAQRANAEVARRLRKLGVRGEFVREVEKALTHAAAVGPIVRRGQPFVGTSFGAEWKFAGKPGRALVTFRGKEVHVEMLGKSGAPRQATSSPTPVTMPLQFQGTRVETWSPRGSDRNAHMRVVGADGEIIQSFEATPSALRAWEKR